MRRTLTTIAGIATILTLAGCGSSGSGSVEVLPQVTLRLGFVTDVSQTTALAGLAQGTFAKNLRPTITLTAIPFRSDAAEAAALAGGRLDAAYASVDTILSTVNAKGFGYLRIVSGTASGGTELVVKSGIRTASDLASRTIAVPATTGPESIALRYWLSQQHFTGASHVTVLASGSPGAAVQDFLAGRADGAWLPAPYDTQLLGHGGHALVSEASLWPTRQFGTTNLVVTQTFLSTHSAAMILLLRGQVAANQLLHENFPMAITAAIAEVKATTGQMVSPAAFATAAATLEFTNDPISATLPTIISHAAAEGVPTPSGSPVVVYNLSPLNFALRLSGAHPIT